MPAGVTTPAAARSAAAVGGGFDRAVALAAAWTVGGVWLDAWAHHAFPELESFVTPWHGALYSGFLALAAVLAAGARGRGAAYRPALVGVPVFFAGGVGDGAWHTLFGVEADLEALVSPTHLLLALGGALMAGGPLRAAWLRADGGRLGGWGRAWPALLSLTLVLSLLSFFTSYANPFNLPWASPDRGALLGELRPEQAAGAAVPEQFAQVAGITGLLLHGAVVAGVVLCAVRRWPALPPGALTLVLGLNAALAAVPHGQYRFVAAGALAGVAADALLARLRPGPARPAALRLFAFAVPAALAGLFFLVLAATDGVAWSVHLWAGAVVLAGAAGALLSYLALPPAARDDAPPA